MIATGTSDNACFIGIRLEADYNIWMGQPNIQPDVNDAPDIADNSPVLSRRELMELGAAAAAVVALASAGLRGDAKQDSAPNGPGGSNGPIEAHVGVEMDDIGPEIDLARHGRWNQPGVAITSEGLEITRTNIRTLNKRVKPKGQYDPNPSISILGTRMQAEGDFSVSTQVAGDSPISINLYGQPPLDLDDVRFERSRLECRLDRNTLNITVWDGARQQPAITQRMNFVGTANGRSLEVQRIDSELRFMVNGAQVGSVQAGSIFRRGEIWFGLNNEDYSLDDKTDLPPVTLRDLKVRPLNGHKVYVVDTTTLEVLAPLPDGGLQGAADRTGMRIGTSVIPNELVSDARLAQLVFGGEVRIVTPENSLKPQRLQPREGVFTFEEADAFVDLMRRRGIEVHGHAVMYDKAMPEWMQNLKYDTEAEKQHVREVLENHVRTVVGHFRGRIKRWDVLNEIVDGFGKCKIKDNIWHKALGDEYIAIVLSAARQADPDAEFFLNDYGMETDPKGRGQFMVDLVKKLNKSERLVDGVGFECHVYNFTRDRIRQKKLQDLMQQFESINVDVRVSELDVVPPLFNSSERQARLCALVAKLCMDAPNCHEYEVWGLYDGAGSETGIDRNGRLHFAAALMYALGYRAKLSRRYVLETLQGFRDETKDPNNTDK